MKREIKCVTGILILVLGLLPNTSPAQETEATKRLKARSLELREDIIRVTDNVYTSVGHTVSTVSMIIGDDGLVIIDAGQQVRYSSKILAEFRKISDKPIKAVIITHGHGDHTGGLSVFTQGGNTEIWARENYGSEAIRTQAIGLRNAKGAYATGWLLPPEKRINNGVAPAQPRPERRERIAPNRTFSESRKTLTVAGITLELVAAPGETADQLYVWYPEKKVIFAGDNFYRSFPNIYPLRGLARRSAVDWANSVDMMLQEGPVHLVGGHTRPYSGADTVTEVLTNYRDAIRFVFEKSIEGMNKGLSMRELVEYVQLPAHLAEKDYLGEYYGKVSFVVQDIYVQNRGWFDGNSTNLQRLSPREEASRMAELVGGPSQLLKKAERALQSGDYQWAAQLADHLLFLDKNAVAPKRIKADAFEAMADFMLNAPGRNHYLTEAQEIRKEIEEGPTGRK